MREAFRGADGSRAATPGSAIIANPDARVKPPPSTLFLQVQ